MPHCPGCFQDFIAYTDRHLDHWIDPFCLRASINCPSCGKNFEIWKQEFLIEKL